MRLATRNNGTRDGALYVVHPDGARWSTAADIYPNVQAALDDWANAAPKLTKRAGDVASGTCATESIDWSQVLSPLPRAYEWVDGSAYINHIILVRKARGAEPPPTLRTEPLVYQGGSSTFLSPKDSIPLHDEAWGCDFESEVCAILTDTPQLTSGDHASKHIALLMLANDVTLRNLVPDELSKGFGFFQSKPSTAFSPFAVTPDELGSAWKQSRIHLPLQTTLNDQLVGDPNAGPEMFFSFSDLIAHISKTRGFGAGTILGSGTVSNEDTARGISCLAEKRTRETLETGKPITPFLKFGDRVRIKMCDGTGRDIFGEIDNTVQKLEAQK